MSSIKYIFIISLSLISYASFSQIITREDSLNAGLVPSNSRSVISGYGEALVSYDLRSKTGVADLRRNVLFFGHKFDDKVSFFSEMEIEHAVVEEGGHGELAMEQLFLKFNLNKKNYLAAGLIIPRIGIVNENHLPTTYNGNDRPFVERFIIPSTWRELGVSLYGTSNRVAGLNYSCGIMNGLNSADFAPGTGIRGGRGEGSKASATNIAATGALLYYTGNWRLQTSAYFGGSAGLPNAEADTLGLQNGTFGTPVQMFELNVQRLSNIYTFKALGAFINIPDAAKINAAYGNGIAQSVLGGYVEFAYNLMHLVKRQDQKQVLVFARYEWLDLDYKTPTGVIRDNTLNRQYIVTGLTYQPTRGVTVKADYVHRITGKPAVTEVDTPATVFYSQNGIVNIGVGYSF